MIPSGLPGEDLVRKGILDLECDKYSVEALLVAIGAPRLRRLGIALPAVDDLPSRPEHALYNLLEADDGRNAHSRYNALVRRLVSFEQAAEFYLSRESRRV